MRNIFLYGPMGSGKSSVGKQLATNLAIGFRDLDSEIEKIQNLPIKTIISKFGENYFRDIESSVLAGLLGNNTQKGGCDPLVIALGGGTLLREENRTICESTGEIIFLDVDYQTLLHRLMTDDPEQRPLLVGDIENKLKKILTEREEHYAGFEMRIANISADGKHQKTIEGFAWDVQLALGRYRVSGMGKPYDVLVEAGAIHRVGELLRDCGLTGPTVVIGDTNTIPLYGDIVQESLRTSGYTTTSVMIEAGEANKTVETIAKIWRGLLSAGMDRKGIVIALGGGVVGDLSGFAASTFMRGCRWVGVPTTLLSMVDASIGGKTGFDLPEGKNLIGSFHSPSLVVADPQVLTSLPVEEIKSGLAEVIKHGIIADPELFQLCARGLDWLMNNMVPVVRRAMGVKIKIIQEDPYEAGVRAALNLGHTVGHAIEIASHFRLRHGEAVAIGMVVEAGMASHLQLSTAGLVEKITKTLDNVGLPTSIPPGLNREVIFSAMKLDKKKDKNTIKFALPIDIGSVLVGVAVDNLEGIL